MNPIIREATVEDMSAMVGLLGELFSLEPDFSGDLEKQQVGAELLLQNDQGGVMVAEIDGSVVGMVTSQFYVSTAEGAKCGFIEDMVVSEKFRGQGIGALLLTAIEEWSFANGATRVVLHVDMDNETAQAFYQKQGWKRNRQLSFWKFK